ncbi:GNAT family N-acetyltransferase [Actinacidiphila sp. ITFR-21]|uniref:GNAT family N-acetyltransferase n=1 Tax=Actinacidiphila sp. ITFR-21 TaxID=3075199 RepID=UPI00288C39B9|nr:GNAT family N-acetyltransferase [Streptomyces sp. ITFR-21]WNI15193.1 GNAT family N-acetyltransferase [Streptomyces sp. ITFR-21]
MILRPVRDDEEDAEVVREISAAAFGAPRALYAAGSAPRFRAGPGSVAGAPGAGGRWPAGRIARHHGRTRHLARTDPGGCWLIEDQEAGPVGAVLSYRREGTWALSLLAVVPGAQGKGVGKALLARALVHGRACLRGVVCLPDNPVAARTLRRAGFHLHPALRLSGPPDPDRLTPPDGPVHMGTERHRDLLDSVDRRTRGGAHGADHEELLRHYRLFVVDDLAGSGYCYTRDGRVELLAATSRRLATRLLTAALLATPPGEPTRVDHVLAEAQWAVDVGVTAGLEIASSGFVALRGMRPPDLALLSRALP